MKGREIKIIKTVAHCKKPNVCGESTVTLSPRQQRPKKKGLKGGLKRFTKMWMSQIWRKWPFKSDHGISIVYTFRNLEDKSWYSRQENKLKRYCFWSHSYRPLQEWGSMQYSTFHESLKIMSPLVKDIQLAFNIRKELVCKIKLFQKRWEKEN